MKKTEQTKLIKADEKINLLVNELNNTLDLYYENSNEKAINNKDSMERCSS